MIKIGDLVRTTLKISQTGIVLNVWDDGVVETTFGMAHETFLEVVA